MKTLITSIALLALTSCTKEWDCTITTTVGGNEQVGHYTLKGDKQDKIEFEESGTKETSIYTQVTECN